MKRKIHRELENPWKSFIWGLNPTSFRLRFPFNHSLELSLVSYRFHHFHPKGHNWGIYGVYSTPSSRPQTYRDFIPTVRPCSACSRKRPWDTALFAWSNVIPATKTHQIWDMDRNGVFAPKDGTFCGNVGDMIFSAITCFGGLPSIPFIRASGIPSGFQSWNLHLECGRNFPTTQPRHAHINNPVTA